MNIVPLPQTKEKNGYAYKLVQRSEHAAIYEMHNVQEPEDKSVAWEVFKIVISPEVTLVGKTGKTKGKQYHYPAAEKFPGNEAFGVTAWTYRQLTGAQAKFNEINHKKHVKKS